MQQALPHSHWHYPTSIYFGNGRIHMLAGLCEQMKMHNPLLVTDEGLATFAFIKDLQASLNNAPIYSAIKANPNGKNIEDGVGVYRQGRHDGIVAVGGGSALDAAKAMALMVGQARSLWDFEDVGDNHLRVKVEAMAQVIAIPTTAGTGSEVGRAALIVDEDSQRKRILFHPNMLPSQVILDPELTLGLPPAITSATGLDAFVHNLEAYLAPGFHPMADGIALQGMAMIKRWLPLAYADGQNLQARGHMLCASTMGATAFQKGLGGVHALAHPLGAIYDKPHGLLNAILLPYVLQKNKAVIADKMPALCAALGLAPGYDAFFSWLLALRAQLGTPNTLADIGLDTRRGAAIGRLAWADTSSQGNPQGLSAEDYTGIFTNAVEGGLYI